MFAGLKERHIQKPIGKAVKYLLTSCNDVILEEEKKD